MQLLVMQRSDESTPLVLFRDGKLRWPGGSSGLLSLFGWGCCSASVLLLLSSLLPAAASLRFPFGPDASLASLCSAYLLRMNSFDVAHRTRAFLCLLQAADYLVQTRAVNFAKMIIGSTA